MELANGLLDSLVILLMIQKTEGAKWMLYESTYNNIECLFGKILKKATTSGEDKKRTLMKLFEILQPLSNRPIGKRFGLAELYDQREWLIKSAISKDEATE